ncbi:MAG: hypothetical protein ABSD47_19670 [Candidatus Methylomirabilota bacterium]
MDVGSAFEALKNALGLLTSAVSLAREAKELLPDDDKKKSMEEKLDAAEKATKTAEARIAQSLGYQLCKCTFPPQIMLSAGNRENYEEFRCPACKKIWPPPGQEVVDEYQF